MTISIYRELSNVTEKVVGVDMVKRPSPKYEQSESRDTVTMTTSPVCSPQVSISLRRRYLSSKISINRIMSQYFGRLLCSIMQQVVYVYNLLYLSGFELEWIESEFTEQQSAIRPNCSYSCMISMALNSSKAQRLHLSKIISFIESRFPYYNSNHGDWKIEIRRTLSQSGYFRKMWTSRGADGLFRVLYWGFNPSTKAAAEDEINKWLASGRDGWAPGEHGNNGEDHIVWDSAPEPDGRNDCTDQFPRAVGHKRPHNDTATQHTPTGEEDCFTRLPPKRRWMIQNNWPHRSIGDETTSTHSVDLPHTGINKRERQVIKIEEDVTMMCNSQNVEFDGVVQMDIETQALTLG